MQPRSRASIAVTFLALAASACTVVPIAEDQARRAQRSGDFDAATYVEQGWNGVIASELHKSTVDYRDLAPGLVNDLSAAGKAHGRQAADGSPWVFVVTGEASVTAVNRASRAGTIVLMPAGGGTPLTVPAGPVVISSALRDALPMFDFNDFPDQLSFAAANKALNDKARIINGPVLSALKPGDRVRFLGALSVGGDKSARIMVPIRVERIGG